MLFGVTFLGVVVLGQGISHQSPVGSQRESSANKQLSPEGVTQKRHTKPGFILVFLGFSMVFLGFSMVFLPGFAFLVIF